MSDILDDFREWQADRQRWARDRTHHDRCHMHHDECMVARLADEVARLRDEVARLSHPATWQDECAVVEAAFEQSGVRPTWPNDEPGSIAVMAAVMAAEISRLRGEVGRLRNGAPDARETVADHDAAPAARAGVSSGTGQTPTLTDAEREALEWAATEAESWATEDDDTSEIDAHAVTLRAILARHGGGE